jgi:poly(hydroxyalkanoate) granule-associated protein
MKLESVQSRRHVSIRQVGLAGLGVVGKVQKESVRLFEILVEEGKRVETRRDKAAQTPVPAALKALRDKALAQLNKLQEVVQEGSARVLHVVGLPSLIDIQAISTRLDELQASIQDLIPESRAPESRARKTALAAIG